MILLIPILLLLGSLPLLNHLDPDFGWHVFVGQKMIDTGQLVHNMPGYGFFSYLKIADHEWLSEIIMALFYKHLGYTSLVVLAIVACFTTFSLLLLLNKKSGLPKDISILVVLLAIMPYYINYGTRLQLMIPLSAVLFYLIAKFVNKYYLRLIIYFFLFALGVNIHGGFVVLAAIPTLLELYPQKDKDWKNALKRTAGVVLTIIVALLINPYGLDYWRLMFDYMQDSFYKSHITEWLPIYAPNICIGAIINLSIFLFVLTIDNFWKKIRINELALLLMFLFLGVKYRRFYPLFAIVSAPYIGLALVSLFHNFKIKKHNIAVAIITIIIFATCISILRPNLSTLKNIDQNPITMDHSYPERATLYLKNHMKDGNLFNCYDWGGYLLLENPNINLFIDGRAPQTKISQGKTIFQEYFDFFSNDADTISNNLNQYNINWILIPNATTNQRGSIDRFIVNNIRKNAKDRSISANLISYLEKSNKWVVVYKDNQATIYKKIIF